MAIFGLTWIVAEWASFMTVLTSVAAAVFILMGWLLIRHAGTGPATDGRLTRPGRWHGLTAGLAAILGNPKAVLFYMGVLPGFFDLRHLSPTDIAAIAALSMSVPLAGNLALAAAVGRARNLLRSPEALRRINLTAGALLIVVGLLIAVLRL